jgi:hypothetical protein
LKLLRIIGRSVREHDSVGLEANRIVFTDTSANDPQQLQAGEGTYIFVRTAAGIDLRKVQDENSWRSERFEGPWASSH